MSRRFPRDILLGLGLGIAFAASIAGIATIPAWADEVPQGPPGWELPHNPPSPSPPPPPPPGSNAGGALVLHSPVGLVYTGDVASYCGASAITNCYELNDLVSGDDPAVVFLLAAFPPGISPRVKAVTFGIEYGDVFIVASETCGDFALPGPTWPQSGSGSAVTWSAAQTTRLVEVYWFGVYHYSSYGPQSMVPIPHPVQGAFFGDDAIPPNVNEITQFGALGFEVCVEQTVPFCGGSGTCPPHGACCASNGTCTVVFDFACTGEFMGDQTVCNPTPCPGAGACCFLGGSGCTIFNEAACSAAGGDFAGAGTQCPAINVGIIYEANGTIFVHAVGPPVDCGGASTAARSGGPCPPSGPYFDTWTSEADDEMCHVFGVPGSPPIPADFFAPGSEPFTGTVCLEGVPLGHPDYGEADTIIERSDDPFDRCTLPSSTEVTVEITVAELSLESIDPITVVVSGSSELWDVFVDLSSVPAPAGWLAATKTHCNGGTYTSTLHVRPRFTFTKVGDPGEVRILDTGLLGIPPVPLAQLDPRPWTSDIGVFGGASDRCSAFHAGFQTTGPLNVQCDCNGNGLNDVCDIESGLLADCNLNAVPDSCDIAMGTSGDQDGNGVPDECPVVSSVQPGGSIHGPDGVRIRMNVAPNPSQAQVRVGFALTRSAQVTVSVVSVDGREVATLLDRPGEAGDHALEWNARDDRGELVPAGVYFAKLALDGRTVSSTRFVLVR